MFRLTATVNGKKTLTRNIPNASIAISYSRILSLMFYDVELIEDYDINKVCNCCQKRWKAAAENHRLDEMGSVWWECDCGSTLLHLSDKARIDLEQKKKAAKELTAPIYPESRTSANLDVST